MKAFLARALVFVFPCVAVAQIASLQIKVLEGEGATHPPGAHIARPLTVQVTDDMGQPVAGAAVSFLLPPDGPSGLFSNGLRTDLAITDAAGRAPIHSIQFNRTGGQFRIRITAVKEQARAGIVSVQYISESGAAPVAPEEPAAKAAPPEPAPRPAAKASPNVTPTEPSAERSAERSPGITPTTAKMGTRIGKKWIVLAVIVVAGGVAALALTHASPTTSSTGSCSAACVGTPTITIGNPNQ